MSERQRSLLTYLDNPTNWEYWLMEGRPKPYQAAALLTNWLALFETSVPEHRIDFWTLRAAMFYDSLRRINYQLKGEWTEGAKFFDWNGFLSKIKSIPEETRFIFFPGKFRTLPTPTQIHGIRFGLEDFKGGKITSALILDSRENITKYEGEKPVLDDQIRIWAFSQLPVDIITTFPSIPDSQEVSQFYASKYNEIRTAKRGEVGVGVGISPHRDDIINLCQRLGIDVIDTSLYSYPGAEEARFLGDTSDFDKLSAESDLANMLILKYLKYMGQI